MTKVLSPRVLKCPVTGKAAYASKGRAEARIERSRAADPGEGRPIPEAYQCRHCYWWHLTKGRPRG